MRLIPRDDPIAIEVSEAIQKGDLSLLERLLREHRDLASSRIGDERESRTLLHVATDWPGHFPNGRVVVTALIEAGADVDAGFVGTNQERPLHSAASSDDVDVIDALLDGGADIEAPGSVLGGGSALSDAVGFGQWKAARRLIDRGARTTLWQAAALGLLDRVEERFVGTDPPSSDEINDAFWQACHGGHRVTAEYLLARGADPNWIGWNDRTPLDIALSQERDADDVVEWLRSIGARSASELG